MINVKSLACKIKEFELTIVSPFKKYVDQAKIEQ
jgi:hypothetical protein